MLKREKLIKSNAVFKGKIITVFDDEVEGITGKPERREVVRHKGGVAAVALTDKNEVILVRQYRYATGEEMLEIPAGKLDAGENPEACGRRELIEEAGITADRFELLTVLRPTVGYCDEKLYIYLAAGLTFGECKPDEGEDLETLRLPLDGAVEMIKRGEITDGKTIAGLFLARDKTNKK